MFTRLIRYSAVGTVLMGFLTLPLFLCAAQAQASPPDTSPPQTTIILEYDTRAAYIQRDGKPTPLAQGLQEREQYSVLILNMNRYRYRASVTMANNTLFAVVPETFQPFVAGKRTGEMTQATVELLVKVARNGGPSPGGIPPKRTVENATVPDIETTIILINALGEELQGMLTAVTSEEEARSVKDVVAKAVTRTFAEIGKSLSFETEGEASEFISLTQRLLAQLPRLRTETEGEIAKIKQPTKKAAEVAQLKRRLAVIDELLSKQAQILAKAKQVAELALAAQTEEYMRSSHGPFQATGDINEITITVTPLAGGGGATPPPSETLTLSVPITSGMKIDFSIGLLWTELSDFNYSTTAVTIDGQTRYRIIEDKSPGMTFATTAFAHAYKRSTGNTKLALSLGLSIGEENMYAPGISLLLGRNQRLVATVGLAVGKVRRLAGGQRPGAGHEIVSSTPSTAETYKHEPFLAVSYNF